MVASISARKSVAAAAAYYAHMGKDDYYARDGAAPGRWEGRAAERLSLEGPVSKSEFNAALSGLDPKTGARLVQANGRAHAAGWDMTFSAPKSVSVLWALSSKADRAAIEAAHQNAVRRATRLLEDEAAWARRGKAGKVRERVAGLLVAAFDHHTSRDLDPQLHTHAFVFNLAPRRDGSWGAIVSRELYRCQKQAGLTYRNDLANGLDRAGVETERDGDFFRVKAIPKAVEQAFSKRRNAIEKAAETHGYATPKGMEMAALRTRKTKRFASREALFDAWRGEAKALGFELKQQRSRRAQPEKVSAFSPATAPSSLPRTSALEGGAGREKPLQKEGLSRPAPPNFVRLLQRLASQLDGPARMPGVRIDLRERQRKLERE